MRSLFYIKPKFQASSHLRWLYSPMYVGPGRKPRRLVFSQRGSFYNLGTIERTMRHYRGCSFSRNTRTEHSGIQSVNYRNFPKFSDARPIPCNLPKVETKRPNLRVFRQKDANGIANSEDPDQTAPLGAIRSGSSLFAQTNMSENRGSLRYLHLQLRL